MRVFTVPQFEQYIKSLPKELEKHSEEITGELAKSLQRRMRTRINTTTFYSVGNLKENIKVEKEGKKAKIVGPYYWKFINLGIGPSKPIPLEFLKQHMASPDKKGKRVANPTWVNTPEEPFYWGANKGFVDNAIISWDADVPKVIERSIIKALE